MVQVEKLLFKSRLFGTLNSSYGVDGAFPEALVGISEQLLIGPWVDIQVWPSLLRNILRVSFCDIRESHIIEVTFECFLSALEILLKSEMFGEVFQVPRIVTSLVFPLYLSLTWTKVAQRELDHT